MKHNKKEFVKNLLAWYEVNRRSLPWRKDVSAYHTWVSEIMLQQTRVEAVIPYYERFLKELPTIQDLTMIDDDKLAKLWEGLGYYSRVRNMKKCAIACVDHYNGALPQTYDELIALPGIGPYSAGAIASIAYREAVPAVDGNVLRVFSRVLLREDDILKESTKRKFQDIIIEYIPKDKPDIFNQAVMEIGALICIPNGEPKCDACPLAKDCYAYQSGNPTRLPIKMKKKKRKIEFRTIIGIIHDGKVVLQQRPKSGLLADLYEFTTLEGNLSEQEVLDYITREYQPIRIKELPEAKHIFSHIEWKMIGYLIEVTTFSGKEIQADVKDLNDIYAIPTAYKTYREHILKELRKKE